MPLLTELMLVGNHCTTNISLLAELRSGPGPKTKMPPEPLKPSHFGCPIAPKVVCILAARKTEETNRAFKRTARVTMNHCKSSFVILIVILGASLAQGQRFQDLDFEQANPVRDPLSRSPYDVTAASAFPGWTVTIGSVQERDIVFNEIIGALAEVVLIAPGARNGFGAVFPIAGIFSALLR